LAGRKNGAPHEDLRGGCDRCAAAKPDVIVHELTALADVAEMRNFDATFAQTNRLRTEATDHLIAAGKAAGIRRMVAQSYCGWP
jgi:hypothetical protein